MNVPYQQKEIKATHLATLVEISKKFSMLGRIERMSSNAFFPLTNFHLFEFSFE